MTAVSVINIILPIGAALSFLVALFFIIRGVRQRTHSSRAPYNVGKQEAQYGMRFDFARGIVALAASLILFGVFLLLPSTPAEADLPPPNATPEPASVTLTPLPLTPTTATASPSVQPSLTPLPTVAVVSPTAVPTSAPTSTPSPTATPVVETAVVTSGVGVWLRDTPSVNGEQVEWLLESTIVTLLDGQTTAEEFEWQQVQSPSGNIGWVATPFIQVTEP